jgi:hypothetical protein
MLLKRRGCSHAWSQIPPLLGQLGGYLEDVPRDNSVHQQFTAIYPKVVKDQGKRRDQHRFSAKPLVS